MTTITSQCLDALDQWCLHNILHILYVVYATYQKLRCRNGQPTSAITTITLCLIGHVA